jgi:hypothetical protein
VAARAGRNAAITWSRCARRSAGAPVTSSSRSGRKTETSGRVATSVEALDGAPSTRRRFGLAGLEADGHLVRRAVVSRLEPPAGVSSVPNRTTSRSLAVRQDRPVHAK